MKKTLLLLVCLVSVYFVNAQFTKGQKMIGGQFAFSMTNSGQSTTPGNADSFFDIGISPSFSRFISPSVFRTIGFSYEYNHYRYNLHSPTEQTNFSHTFGIYGEHTKLEQLVKRFYFTYGGRIGLTYGYGKTENTIPGNNTEQNNYGAYASAGLGLLYQVNQRFLFSCGLNNLVTVYYNHIDSKTYSGTVFKSYSNNAGLTTGLSNISLSAISIVVRYMLKK